MTQKLHLMIGTSPFLSCHFCTTPRDYQLFSIGHHLFQFAASLILFGLLTVRFDSLEVFDEVVYSLLEMTLGRDMRLAAVQANQEAGQLRADGHVYRVPFLYLLSSFLLAQAAVYLNLIDASFGHGRWDHVSACREGMPSVGLTLLRRGQWHANFSIAFHVTLLISSTWIYFAQRIPEKPVMLEIVSLIKQSRSHASQTLSHVQAMHLTNQVIWSDVGLRHRAAEWFDGRHDSFEQLTGDAAMDKLGKRAERAGAQVGPLRQTSLAAAREVWEGTQSSSQEWERALALQQTVRPSP